MRRAGTGREAGSEFIFGRDTFAFANETVWHYGHVPGQAPDCFGVNGRGEKPKAYTRRCFVMSCAAIQFWKMAAFRPEHPKPDDERLARSIRSIRSGSVWAPGLDPERRVMIPGYRCLRDASADRVELFQRALGPGWTTYFRFGNQRIMLPITRRGQERLQVDLSRRMDAGLPSGLWLINFPSVSINHSVVAYGKVDPGDGTIHYLVYDPNYIDGPRKLIYDPARRSFIFERTFYFRGGKVNVRPVFQRRWQ